jgi:hypothetical protein
VEHTSFKNLGYKLGEGVTSLIIFLLHPRNGKSKSMYSRWEMVFEELKKMTVLFHRKKEWSAGTWVQLECVWYGFRFIEKQKCFCFSQEMILVWLVY